MASRRRSLEEKNLKILRELAAFPYNKQCFDCHQRGPTYINMTIGSFVCTSCSGLLRGLTPPHRVKSITMTMFTPEEIEFLKSRGNEYCKYVWLGTYDSRANNNTDNDVKDDHRKRDLMSQKYEKKRWYVDPDIAIRKMQHEQQNQHVRQPVQMPPAPPMSRQYARVPEVQPLSQLFEKMPAPLVVENNKPNFEKWPQPVSSASAPHVTSTKTMLSHGTHSLDLLSEFAGNTMVSPSSGTAPSANGNFANFDSAFSSFDTPAMQGSPFGSLSRGGGHGHAQLGYEGENFDRYAALADLDSCFNKPISSTSGWSASSTNTATTTSVATFGFQPRESSANVFTSAMSNPFAAPTSVPWPQPTHRQVAAANPFQSIPESGLPQQPMRSNYAPLPVVGNSPTDDMIPMGTTSRSPFASFATAEVSSPSNGYSGGSLFTQNGEFASSGRSMWGIPPSASMPVSLSTSQTSPLGVEKQMSLDYSSWPHNSANPFLAGPNETLPVPPKSNSSNPFL